MAAELVWLGSAGGGRVSRCGMLVLLWAAGTACAGPRLHAGFEASYRAASTVALVEPDVTVEELSLLDLRRPNPEWSAAARENVARAVTALLERRGFAVVRPARTAENAALQDDILNRYRALDPVLTQAWQWPSHGFTPGPFDFSLGPVDTALGAWGSDLLVMVSGSDEVSDAARVIEQILKKDDTWGTATLRIALVNRSGTVVWFSGSIAEGGNIDLRSVADAMTLAGRVLAALPPR